MISSRFTRLAVLPSAVILTALVAACGDQTVPQGGGGTSTTSTNDTTTSGSTTTASGGGGTGPTACELRIKAKVAAATDLASYNTNDVAAMAAGAATAPYDDTGFAGHYRDDLTKHPGCAPRDAADKTYAGQGFLNTLNTATVAPGVAVQSTDATKPGYVPGFTCAAKEYTGGTVDTTKPIVILVHGNSSSPNSWEEYANTGLKDADTATDGIQLTSASKFTFTTDDQTKPRAMLATKLVAAGYRVIAVDLRADLVPKLKNAVLTAGATDPGYGDSVGNMDHGWSVPIVQSLIKSVIAANPNQKISLVGHSLGATVIQDALRRTYNEFKAGTFTTNPFSKIKGVVLASGAIHGVNGGTTNCSTYTTMRGKVNCEMGDRGTYTETAFHKPNNGPNDLFAVPCADGSYAFNKDGECGGNTIKWFTTTIADPPAATLRDEFVSEAAARINMDDYDPTTKVVKSADCVENNVNPIEAYDPSGFFMDFYTFGLQGFFANHFGSIRSDAGMKYIVDSLAK